MVLSVSNYTFAGAGFLVSIHYHLEQRVPLTNITHINLRTPKPAHDRKHKGFTDGSTEEIKLCPINTKENYLPCLPNLEVRDYYQFFS